MPRQKTTKTQIVREAMQVFHKKGYYRSSMSDLAKAAGLTKGAFYHYFSSKEAVMLAALQAHVAWFEKKIFSIADEIELLPKERLEKMAQVIFKAFTQTEGGCFFANTVLETAHVEDTFKPAIRSFFKAWEQALGKVLAPDFSSDYLSTETKEIAQRIIADIEGSIVLMQLYGDTSILRKALDRAVAVV